MPELISSDTNVWLDFEAVSRIEFPFRLSVKYIMYYEALQEEIKEPEWLLSELRKRGLEGVDLSEDEFFYADRITEKYRQLSTYDRTALAIAKHRQITLLTGDNNLRKAAKAEGVVVIGTIGLMDRLLSEGCISREEYKKCLTDMKNHPGRRLPIEIIDERIAEL